jgi:hypothetical protein
MAAGLLQIMPSPGLAFEVLRSSHIVRHGKFDGLNAPCKKPEF